jgi:biotin carboxylase
MSQAEDVTHVLVGFGKGITAALDLLLPVGSVLLVEEDDVVVARNIEARLSALRCVRAITRAPIHDEHDLRAVVAGIPRPPQVRAVIPATEYAVVAAAALAEAWGLPGAGVTAASVLRNKIELRTVADSAGLPQPRWQEAYCPGDVAAFRARHGSECVLKPASRQASLGVQLLGAEDPEDLAWTRTTQVEEPKMRTRRPLRERYLVEERLRGPEVSTECLVSDGAPTFLNITAKSVRPGPHPVEIGHTVPAPVDGEVAESLDRAVRALIAATGFRSGFLHAEWMLPDGSTPRLVECAGRLPGDSITDLIDLAYGGSIVADLTAVLEGRRPARSPRARRGAAIRFLTAAPGVVRSVLGVETAKHQDGVHEVEVDVGPGTTVGPVTSSWDRAGHVVAVGPTARAAEHRAVTASGEIVFEIA